SGKLPVTFPRSVGQVPIYYAQFNTGRPLSDDKSDGCTFEKFRSNYLDECNTPLYEFGFGLSYTTFEISNLKLDKTTINQGDSIKVSVQVKNTGNYDGAEVVQLYTSDLVGSIIRPVKELKGFKKVFLKKGESKTVEFNLTTQDLKFYNSAFNFVAEPGEFEVFVGNSSNAKLKSKFELK